VNANNAEVVPVHMMQGPSLLFDNPPPGPVVTSAWARSRGGLFARNLARKAANGPDVFRDARFFERGHIRLAFRERITVQG